MSELPPEQMVIIEGEGVSMSIPKSLHDALGNSPEVQKFHKECIQNLETMQKVIANNATPDMMVGKNPDIHITTAFEESINEGHTIFGEWRQLSDEACNIGRFNSPQKGSFAIHHMIQTLRERHTKLTRGVAEAAPTYKTQVTKKVNVSMGNRVKTKVDAMTMNPDNGYPIPLSYSVDDVPDLWEKWMHERMVRGNHVMREKVIHRFLNHL